MRVYIARFGEMVLGVVECLGFMVSNFFGDVWRDFLKFIFGLVLVGWVIDVKFFLRGLNGIRGWLDRVYFVVVGLGSLVFKVSVCLGIFVSVFCYYNVG